MFLCKSLNGQTPLNSFIIFVKNSCHLFPGFEVIFMFYILYKVLVNLSGHISPLPSPGPYCASLDKSASLFIGNQFSG